MCSHRYNTLPKFFEEFFAVLSTLRNERDHCTLMALAKRRVDIQNPVELEYASFLTPYALSHVVKQLALRSKVGVIQEAGNVCQVSSSEGVLRVTPNKCGCTFWTSTHLPCRHILAVRERKQLPLFSTDLVSHKWTVDYMKEAYDLKLEQMSAETFQVCVHVHVSICRWTVLMHVASVLTCNTIVRFQ